MCEEDGGATRGLRCAHAPRETVQAVRRRMAVEARPVSDTRAKAPIPAGENGWLERAGRGQRRSYQHRLDRLQVALPDGAEPSVRVSLLQCGELRGRNLAQQLAALGFYIYKAVESLPQNLHTNM